MLYIALIYLVNLDVDRKPLVPKLFKKNWFWFLQQSFETVYCSLWYRIYYSQNEKKRNDLFRKGNYFYYPKLTLSTGFLLEAGVCSVKFIRDLCHKKR